MTYVQQGAGSADASDRLERSARLWLRAYPRRWRAAFGDDLVGVLQEVGPPDSSRVPAPEAVAIVRAGWALRLREHPPLLRWLGYRMLDLRLPLRYQHWVADDILGMLWGARFMTTAVLLWLAFAVNFYIDGEIEALTEYLEFVAVIGASFALFLSGPFGRAKRRAAWQRHISPEVPWILLSSRDKVRTPHAASEPARTN